jgi:DNA-binding beta-propeller fold protein YncE
MKRLALLLLLSMCVTAVGTAQNPSPVPGDFGPDPANMSAPTAPTAPPAGVPMLPFKFGARPVPPLGQKFGNVAAVALTPEGHLLVFNRNVAIEMVEYDATGSKVLRVFNPNIAINPHALRVDRYGNIWASDAYWNVVWKLNSKGEVLMMLGKRGENGAWDDAAWNGMFNQPLDVAFDQDDNFYVVQGHGGTSPPEDCSYCTTYPYAARPDRRAVAARAPVVQGSDPRLLKFDKSGRFIASVSLAHPTGPFATIHTIVTAPSGELWVGDRNAKKLIVLDRNLKRLREIEMGYLTCGLFVDAQGGLWMSAGMNGMVFKLDWNGKILGWFGKWGNNPDSNDIGEAHQLAVSRDLKTVYVADSVLAHVLKIESN